MAYGEIFLGDVMICAGEGEICGRFIFQKQIIYWKSISLFFTVGKGFCTGDTGGPITYLGTHVGIVSFGIGCGRPYFPGIYLFYIFCSDKLLQTLLFIWFFSFFLGIYAQTDAFLDFIFSNTH